MVNFQIFCSSNSKYIVAANSTKRSAVVFDKEQVISTFKIPPASTLKVAFVFFKFIFTSFEVL